MKRRMLSLSLKLDINQMMTIMKYSWGELKKCKYAKCLSSNYFLITRKLSGINFLNMLER